MAATEQQVQVLLAYLGTAMIATGQPVGEVEDELAEVSSQLGYPDVQIAGSPTGITLSLASGSPATFESVNAAAAARSGGRRPDDPLRRAGRISVGRGGDRAAASALRSKPRRFPGWTADLGLVAVTAGLCLILQPGWANLGFAVLGSIAVAGLIRLSRQYPLVATLLPALAAFVVGCGMFAAAEAGLLEGPLRTALPALAVLLPGAILVTAMSELAAGDMMAGAARMIYGIVQLMLFTLGLIAASQLLQVPPELLTVARIDELGWWTAPVGVRADQSRVCC